jgi:hypothetical protein
MLAARITLPQVSISSLIRFANSSGKEELRDSACPKKRENLFSHGGGCVTEDEVIDRLSADFREEIRERIKYVKLCHKGDLDGDDNGRLWHFTRLSKMQSMLAGREIWLTDLAFSNDANEVVYGLTRVGSVVKTISLHWSNDKNAEAVFQLAERAVHRFKRQFHVYSFSLSTERDTVQHWNGYGGGLHTRPIPDDPHVAIGFDAKALFYPLELSSEKPPIYVINTVSGDDAADHLMQYWAIKTRRALEVLNTAHTPLTERRVHDLFEHLLVLVCTLAKNSGWRDEHEYRIIYITPDFGDEHHWLPQRPDGKGRYVPLKWVRDRSPIRAIVPHPLANGALVKKSLRAFPGGNDIVLYQSELKPRPK